MLGDFSDVVSIQYAGSTSPTVEEGDTLRFTAVALGLDGAPLADVTVIWLPLAPDPDTVGFTLDSLTGLLTATAPGGPWQVQGHVESLRTNPPISVRVTAQADSVGVVATGRDTVPVGANASSVLTVRVYDVTTKPDTAVALSGKTVIFTLTDPAAGAPEAAGVAIAPSGGAPGTDPHRVSLVSAAGGSAGIFALRVAGTAQPDSIVIEARALTARGDTVPGPAGRLVVVFLN